MAGLTIVYILFFGGLLAAILPVVGLIIAYVIRRDVEWVMQTHFNYLIRTFWIGCVLIIILTFVTIVGFFIAFFETAFTSTGGSSSISFEFDFFSSIFNIFNGNTYPFTPRVVIFFGLVSVLILGLIIWYIVRLARGLKALYLGREAP